MYGSIMRGRIKPGRRADAERLFAEIAPRHFEHGLLSLEVAWETADPNRFLMIIHFRDRASYERNANRPQTDEDYRRQRELLEEDPEWIDVDYGARIGAEVTA